MTMVMAAINGFPISRVVLAVAGEVARVLDAEIEAVHVVESPHHRPQVDAETQAAAVEKIPMRVLVGEVETMLAARANSSEGGAVVMGLRRAVGGKRPAGHVALAVIGRVHKPVIVVPPVTPVTFGLQKVLVPIQGRPAGALQEVTAIAESAHLETVFLHVHDEWSVPSFEDQPHYDVEAWASEFLARWVPGTSAKATMELRVGTAEEQILRVARDVGADLIAIGWSQDLSPGRATVVRWALEHSPVPLALMPLARGRVGSEPSSVTPPPGRRVSA